MAKNTPHPPSRTRRMLAPGPAVVALGLLVAFTLGATFALWRLSADSPPREGARLVAAPESSPSAPAPRLPPAAVRSSVAVAPPSALAAPARAASDTELQARVAQEVKAQLETLRPYIVSRCPPSAVLERGQASATLTVNSTFDAQGREIARGISEDRRSPAAELARCLRQLEGIALSVSPPGSNIGISVALAFP